MATFRGNLRAAAQVILIEADTAAGTNVFLPRDWPYKAATLPAIALQTPRWTHADRTEGVGPPQFWSQVSLGVHCQVEAPGNEAGAVAVEDQLETLADQVELALCQLIVGPPQLFRRLVSIDGELAIDSSGESHVGAVDLLFIFEYANDIEPVITDRLTELRLAAIQRMTTGGHFGGEFLKTLARMRLEIPQ